MAVNEKIRTIDKEIKKNRAQYDLDRQTAKLLFLSLRNVGKVKEILTCQKRLIQ